MRLDNSIFAVVGGFIASAFEFFYGNQAFVTNGMIALAFFIALDWLAGITAARKDDTYASKYGIEGITRTFVMLLLPAGGHLLDKLFMLPSDVFFWILLVGLLYHILKSFTANAIRAGWGDWLPTWVLEKIISWVKSEIDSKIARALERQESKNMGDQS